MMNVSPAAVAFTEAHEGVVLKAYRCPAGVITIGAGFTMGSKVFAAWWKARHGRALAMGDTMTRAESSEVLGKLLNEEYGAAVNAKIGAKIQHHHDGATSVAYNCGTGALAWRWAQALKRGAIGECGSLLRDTAVTANGRKLAGLVKRRAAEARLIETGDYGIVRVAELPPSVSASSADVRWYQEQLAALGYAVKVTGLRQAKDSDIAVRAFQRDQKLTVDGIVGPATRATIIRALDAKDQKTMTAGGGVTGTAVGGGEVVSTTPDASALDPSALLPVLYWGIGIAVVVAIAFLAWRYRGKFTGRRVPT